MKKHFWKLEYSITIFVLLGFLLIFIPFNFENYLQAQFTNTWSKQYNQLAYTFSAIKAQESEMPTVNFTTARSMKQERDILTQFIEPYLDLRKVSNPKIKRYNPKFLNGTKVSKMNYYYFDDFYISKKGMILGIKNAPANTEPDISFMLMADINGILPPNTWGKDIYGINVHYNGEISPFGYQKNITILNQDCSKKGTGVYCSHLFLIGGEIND